VPQTVVGVLGGGEQRVRVRLVDGGGVQVEQEARVLEREHRLVRRPVQVDHAVHVDARVQRLQLRVVGQQVAEVEDGLDGEQAQHIRLTLYEAAEQSEGNSVAVGQERRLKAAARRHALEADNINALFYISN